MPARPFPLARFAVYAVVIALGVLHLIDRGDAKGAPGPPAGRWVQGTTTQGLPVEVKLADGRVVAVEASWRSRCSDGREVTRQSGFMDAFDGDFARDGQRFADEWETENAGWHDQTARLDAHLEGQAAGGVARGSLAFTLRTYSGDHLMQTCDSGAIGFAVDL
ncbi:MAG TPA: hypothetical protein VF712_10835 [Thermoleophilaceae bacterium]